jgi:hypothetical protein
MVRRSHETATWSRQKLSSTNRLVRASKFFSERAWLTASTVFSAMAMASTEAFFADAGQGWGV